jgi:hypothetical protein
LIADSMGFEGELDVAHRSIGQERFGFAGRARPTSSLDELGELIDWRPVVALLDSLYSAPKSWRPSPPHRHRLQPQAQFEHSQRPSMKAATVPIRAVAMLVIRHRNVEKTICFISELYNHPHTGLLGPSLGVAVDTLLVE